MRVCIRTAGIATPDLAVEMGAASYIQKLEGVFLSQLQALDLIPAETQLVEISVSVMSEQEMHSVNKEYRGVDEATDVLSFPLWEEDAVFAPPGNWENLPLGDIAVCPEVVARNAGVDSREFIAELTLAFCHGLLHLVGFDHDDDEREREMWNLQSHMTEKFLKGEFSAE